MRKNIIFIHAAALSGYKERLLQFFTLIKNSGLLNDLDFIKINVIGDSYNEQIFDDKITFVNLSNNLNTSEQTTIETLYDFCKDNPNNCNILYIHTKGVGKEKNECIEDWVNYMCYFLIEKYKDFIHDLGSKYSTVGVDLLKWPTVHYSGNFWWTTSEHVLSLVSAYQLPYIPNILNSPRHNYEFWICSDGTGDHHKCIHQSNINCLERHLHRYFASQYQT
jgi:hypothetical protein